MNTNEDEIVELKAVVQSLKGALQLSSDTGVKMGRTLSVVSEENKKMKELLQTWMESLGEKIESGSVKPWEKSIYKQIKDLLKV